MTYPNPTNISGIVNMFSYANSVTDNNFVYGVLLTVYIVAFIIVIRKTNNWMEAALTSGFGVSIVAVMLRIMQIMTENWIIYICVVSIVVPLLFALLPSQD